MNIPKPTPDDCLAYHAALRAWCQAQALAIAECRGPQRGNSEIESQSQQAQPERADGDRGGLTNSWPFHSIGIIGAGLMGVNIAAWHLQKGCHVAITDSSVSALETVIERLASELQLYTSIDLGTIDAILARLRISQRVGELADCDSILESIVEDARTKQKLFSNLENYVSPETILLSNTSTIPIGTLANGLRYPERVCGLHFLHPVRCRDLVEVIPHSTTARTTTSRVVAHALAIGKLPVLVRDTPGFVVNRLLFPYLNEALQLIAEGVSPEIIDSAAEAIGFAMGPVCVMDEIGLDTTWAAGRSLWEAFPKRISPSPILVTMLKHRRLGRKVGQGFFDYSLPPTPGSGRPLAPDTSRLLASWIANPPSLDSAIVAIRLVLTMVFEAALILTEQTADDPRTIDACAVFGLGFPPSLGGPLFWVQSVGLSAFQGMIENVCPSVPTTEIFKAIEEVVKTAGWRSLIWQ
ncbi:MAG: 3-hydroxyacyl-CoA dehydrogenase family protein [Thermogutta sp.]